MYEIWLRSFHAVASEGGFTRGAAAIGIGQPTVTAQVRALEDRFGVELFHRAGRSVRPTEAGTALFEVTRTLFGHQQEAIRLLETFGRKGRLRLRFGAANPHGIMGLVKSIGDRLPEFELSVVIEHHAEILRRLLDFELDVAVVGRAVEDPRFAARPYRTLPIDVVVGADHEWAGRKSVRIAELDGRAMIMREAASTSREAFETAANEAGIRIRTVMEINNREAIREAVILGMGLSVGAEDELGSHRLLRWIPLADAEMAIRFNLICLAQRHNRPGIRDVFEIAGGPRP